MRRAQTQIEVDAGQVDLHVPLRQPGAADVLAPEPPDPQVQSPRPELHDHRHVSIRPGYRPSPAGSRITQPSRCSSAISSAVRLQRLWRPLGLTRMTSLGRSVVCGLVGVLISVCPLAARVIYLLT